MSSELIQLNSINKSFISTDGSQRMVLNNVDFTLKVGEIVALLGQSGSGKSTLLRIMAGLIGADSGEALYKGKQISAPIQGVSMVFQSFALFPWLSVQKNVELGLEARGVSPAEQAERAQKAISLIGLEGFEGALPRELSGGMRQRVGIARAIVLEPEVLLMDEAFSALDVMTGERLRDDILELWQSGKLPTKSILVVSHNIEEAVMMADRVLIFSSNPGRVRIEIPISLGRPRLPKSPDINYLVDKLYSEMVHTNTVDFQEAQIQSGHTDIGRLPSADIATIEGLIERLNDPEFFGKADLPDLAEASEIDDKEFLQAVDALVALEFACVEGGDIIATDLGKRFSEADNELRKKIFSRQMLDSIPFIAELLVKIEKQKNHSLSFESIRNSLVLTMDKKESIEKFNLILEWATYADLVEIDYGKQKMYLHNEMLTGNAKS